MAQVVECLPTLQTQGPEFKSPYHKKNKIEKKSSVWLASTVDL
jgi:hypothetical protein